MENKIENYEEMLNNLDELHFRNFKDKVIKMVDDEIEETKGSIYNEHLWELGFESNDDNEGVNYHTFNIEYMYRYIERLKEFRSFIKKNGMPVKPKLENTDGMYKVSMVVDTTKENKNKTCFAKDSITIESDKKIEKDDPNTRYEDKCIGAWNTKEDVDKFFKEHTYLNNWKGLSVGNYVKINDGMFNKEWVIAGFNTETAADGVTGGIVFIPRYVSLLTYNWDISRMYAIPYKKSDIHILLNSTVYNNLSTILGSHIVERDVVLGSACNGTSPRNWTTSKIINTTAYLTLMSWGQLSGTFGSHNNSMDDGEANYKLPLFNFITTATYASGSESFWLRNVYGESSGFHAWCATIHGYLDNHGVSLGCGVRPLMYLR